MKNDSENEDLQIKVVPTNPKNSKKSKTEIEENDWRKEKRHRDGSIKTIKGFLYARIQYLDETTGKRKEKLRRARNRTHARELIKEMRKELNHGGQIALESDKTSFYHVAEKYEKTKLIKPVIQDGRKIAGKRSFQSQIYLIKALKDYFGKRNIRQIKPGDLEAFKVERLNSQVEIEFNRKTKKTNDKTGKTKTEIVKDKKFRPRKIASVNRELSLLREIFKFAETENLIVSNPFSRVRKLISLADEKVRDRILSIEEEKLLLAACDNEVRRHIKPLIIAALDTAARRGELLKLQWKDVDLKTGVITIQATNTKTERTRVIGMTARVKDALARLWDQSPKNPQNLVFGIKGDFKRAWGSALKEVGINDLVFHDLRHTAITRMIRAGVSASETMKVSGHTQIKTFQRYVNLTSESVVVSANLLDSFNAGQRAQIQVDANSETVN